jgi:hypothetical protein
VGHNDFASDRVYFVESDKLLAFINAYKKFVFSFDEKGDIYYESPFTEYRLDTLSVALKDVRVVGDDPFSLGWSSFPLSKTEVGVFKSLYGFAVKDSDSKMLLDGDKAEAFYSLYQYAVRGVPGPDGKVVLRKMDLPIIHEISDGDLYWACTKDRLYFKFGLGVVSFLRVPYDEDSFMYPATFATGEAVGKFRMDIPLVRRALRLVEMLGFNEIEFVQDDESILMVSGGKVRFSVGTGSCHSFGLDAFLFGKIMGTIDEGEKYVDVFVSERGLDIVLNRDIVCTYSLSRTTVTQMRVADKTNMRLGVGLGDTETVTSSSSGASVSLAVKEEMVSFQDADLF